MRGMAFGGFAKVAKGGEDGKAGVAVSDGFVGMLCAASICRLHHLYRLFLWLGECFFSNEECKKAQMLGSIWAENLCVLVVKISERIR
jgi:hypothetical protein